MPLYSHKLSEERKLYSSTVFDKQHTVYVWSSHATVDMMLMALDEKDRSLERAEFSIVVDWEKQLIGILKDFTLILWALHILGHGWDKSFNIQSLNFWSPTNISSIATQEMFRYISAIVTMSWCSRSFIFMPMSTTQTIVMHHWRCLYRWMQRMEMYILENVHV